MAYLVSSRGHIEAVVSEFAVGAQINDLGFGYGVWSFVECELGQCALDYNGLSFSSYMTGGDE